MLKNVCPLSADKVILLLHKKTFQQIKWFYSEDTDKNKVNIMLLRVIITKNAAVKEKYQFI